MTSKGEGYGKTSGQADPLTSPRGGVKQLISNLLISEPPLQVLPTLAVVVGLGEAIFLQQLHYWLERATVHRAGRSWVYNTLEEWQQQLPFWSVMTLRRLIASLEAKGYVEKAFLASDPRDRTAYYTINYAAVASIHVGMHPSSPSSAPCVQVEHMHLSRLDRSNCADRADVLSTETTATKILSCSRERRVTRRKSVSLSGMVCWNKDDARAVERLLGSYGEQAVSEALETWRSSPPNKKSSRKHPFPSEVEAILKQGGRSKELTCGKTDKRNADRRAPTEPGDPLDYYTLT